eukprot:TRINITY_DN16472_c0_g2_i1.p2 TRINITY_DN16472_c0_g2~~TRINITY_DN16472_c0_g2_i1.p2  ORF type:complete len:202 (-),score=6.22 TRINITY_DN16472_c0_g2_i1:176-781(-)
MCIRDSPKTPKPQAVCVMLTERINVLSIMNKRVNGSLSTSLIKVKKHSLANLSTFQVLPLINDRSKSTKAIRSTFKPSDLNTRNTIKNLLFNKTLNNNILKGKLLTSSIIRKYKDTFINAEKSKSRAKSIATEKQLPIERRKQRLIHECFKLVQCILVLPLCKHTVAIKGLEFIGDILVEFKDHSSALIYYFKGVFGCSDG